MLGSSLPNLSGDRWTMVPTSRQSLDSWLQGNFQPKGTIEVLLPESDCLSLTEVQRDVSWFEMRLFRYTSTTAYATIQALDREKLGADEVTLIEKQFGIRLRTAADMAAADPRTKYARYLAMSRQELSSNTKALLKQIMNALQIKGRSKIKDSDRMAREILRKAGQAPAPEPTEFEKFVRNSFLKPTTPSSSMKMGSSNEGNVIVALGHILQQSDIIVANEAPTELGLVCRRDKPYLATSIDGIWAKVKVRRCSDGSFREVPVGVEIKTMTTESSQMTAMAATQVQVDQCKFGDAKFQSTINSKPYRVQVLHHATVLKLEYVLYVVAFPTKVHHCLLIDFTMAHRNTYEAILSNYITQNVLPIYGDPPAPWPEMCQKSLSMRGYVIEPETIAFKLGIWRALNAMVARHKGPIPRLKHFLPTIVVYWDYGKVFVDIISRYLKNLKVPIAQASPALVYIVRNIMTIAINSMIASKLLKEGKEKIDAGCTSYHEFKEHVAKKISATDVAMDLAKNFRLLGVDRGASTSSEPRFTFSPNKERRPVSEDQVSATEVEEVVSGLNEQKKPKPSKYFMGSAATRVRLSPGLRHYCISTKQPKVRKRCCLCSRRVQMFCSVCTVYLCNERPTQSELSCFEIWHSDVSLTEAKKQLTEKNEAKSQEGEGELDERETGTILVTPAQPRRERPRTSDPSGQPPSAGAGVGPTVTTPAPSPSVPPAQGTTMAAQGTTMAETAETRESSNRARRAVTREERPQESASSHAAAPRKRRKRPRTRR